MITFTVPAIPIAQPRPRATIRGHHVYTPKDDPVNQFKASVALAAAGVWERPPLHEHLVLWVEFIFPRPKNKIWKRKPMPRYPHTSRPDIDNLVKSVADSLSGILWRDDSQITALTATKWVAAGDEQPHVLVKVMHDEKMKPLAETEHDNTRP